jgi:hypothetical protein
MNIVYQNKADHAFTYTVECEVDDFLKDGTTISDAVAQTIASWWHSPGSPLSTVLSTMGAVTDDMNIRDFANEQEYDNADFSQKLELDALNGYIEARQGKR